MALYTVGFSSTAPCAIGSLLGLLLLPLMSAGLCTSPAAAENFDAAYRATLVGLTVGEARLTGSVADGAYTMRLNGETRMVGFSSRFDAVAAGKSRNTTLLPQSYKLEMRGRQARTVAINFTADRAAQIVIDPPPAAADLQGRLPIELQHQVGVLDPLSALMSRILSASQTTSPCEGVTRVFSGQMRFDVSLATSDLGLDETVCRVTYRPIAGHKPAENSTRTPPTIVVAFPKTASDGELRLPDRIEFPLPVGTVVIKRVRQ
jgi:uncharacterized protein DUF3108